MHFTSTVALIAAASSLISAIPVKDSFAIKAVPTDSGSALATKEHFISLYHTGAGENVPVLASRKNAPIFKLNGTRLITKYSGEPYGLGFGQPEDLYANWGPMTLDAGYGDKGFAIDKDETIITTSKDIDFGGWRVCNWVHVVPELYVDLLGPSSGKIRNPACETVTLVPVYVPH